MMPSKAIVRVNALLAVGLLAGCCPQVARIYDGVRRASDEVARLAPDPRIAKILTLDGAEVCGTEFELLPGCHVVTAKYEITFVKDSDSSGLFLVGAAVGGAVGGAIMAEAESPELSTYSAGAPVVFAANLRAARTYEVAGLFTGEKFVPQLIEVDPSLGAVGRYRPAKAGDAGATCSDAIPLTSP